jgi:Tfp pilus assembly protein PilN
MRAVNLLPRDVSRRELRKPPVPALVGLVGFVVVTTAVAVLYLSASATVSDRMEELNALQTERESLPPPPKVDGTEDTLLNEKTRRVAAVGAALGKRLPWDRLLREFSLVLPEDVWLISLNATAPAGPGVPAVNGFSITGYTYSHEAVARLLTRLAVVPHLANVRLQSSIRTLIGSRSVVQFVVSADVRPPGATA